MGVRMMELLIGRLDELRYEPTAKRVRAFLGGEPVADTTDARLVWEPRRVVPMYGVPPGDLDAELVPVDLEPPSEQPPAVLGPANFALHLHPGQAFDVKVDSTVLPQAAFRPDDPDLDGRVVLDWGRFEWTEEAEPVTGHPHDAFKRIDVLPSDRHVVVSVGGTVLADSKRAVALYETGLPTRWYLPREDVDLTKLTPSSSTTVCAYKGVATYFSLAPEDAHDEGRDLAWTYVDPLHDAAGVRDLLCFYAERTDLSVDGVDVPRPQTLWSKRD